MSTNAHRKCSKCGTNAVQDNSIRLYRFLKPGSTNILRAIAWATYCWPEKDWSSVESLMALYKTNKVLCSRHFENTCFIDSLKKQLSKHSIPGTKQYGTEILNSLRSKLPVIGQQVISHDIARCSTHQDAPTSQPHCSVAESSAMSDDSSCDGLVVRDSTKKDAPGKNKVKRILKSLNKSKLRKLTEAEVKLYKICKNKVNKIYQLRNKLKIKTKANKIQKICEDENVKQFFDLQLSNSFIVLLQSQLTNCRREQKPRRYNLEQKLLALTLYKRSPSCYRILRRLFSLPCQGALNKLLNKVPMKPGINEHIFCALKAMAETQTDEENLCTLVFDAMAIRKNLNYNPKSDHVDGFQDHGNHGRTEQIACSSLVFMLCGLKKEWKQPIAFYLSAKSVTSDRLSVIIKEVLTECFKAGLNVVATVCDLCSVNSEALHKLGSTTETPYFNHDGREIVTVADPPHLLKCLRNMFMAHDIQITTGILTNGNIVKGTAKWDHVKQFYDLDKINPHFVYAPALTAKHIKPNTRQKMRVKLAAQVFSHTVTAGILAKIATNDLPAQAHATATLLKKIDQLFDCLNANSQDLRRGKKFSRNLTSSSPHLNYFIEMKKFIKGMTFVKARNPPMQSGWVQTITAVERLWRNLRKLGIQSFSTRRLNLDPLENFFGCVRYSCGCNYNPTVSQFIVGFKTAIITDLRHTGRSKNCEDDDGLLSNNLSFLMSPVNQTGQSRTQRQQEDENSEHQEYLIDDTSEISSEIQACAYVCGLVLKKLNNKCTQCVNVLTSIHGSQPAYLFAVFKEHTESKSLNYVSMDLVKAVKRAVALTENFLSENISKENSKEKALLFLKTECMQSFLFLQCPTHCAQMFENILNHVFCVSLKRIIVLKNRDLSE